MTWYVRIRSWDIASGTQVPVADWRKVSTMIDFDRKQQVEDFARLPSLIRHADTLDSGVSRPMDASNQQGYLHRLHTETPTRFWVNNATPDEAKSAIESGVLCATTNPAYLARMLQVDPDMPDLIRQVLERSANIETASEMVYRSAVDRLRVLFEPVYRKSDGRYGYVAIQGDPRVNTDLHAILEEARRYREMGENIIIKVLSTPVGAAALEQS